MAGEIRGITTIDKTTSYGISVTPQLVMTHHKTDTDSDQDNKPSLDANWRFRPAMNFALSLNTDFADAEIDDLQNNLTRFPLFISEKRNFFLNDAGYFGFSDFQEAPLPFFSRRIGVDGEGNPVDVESAIKITGKEHNTHIGFQPQQPIELCLVQKLGRSLCR